MLHNILKKSNRNNEKYTNICDVFMKEHNFEVGYYWCEKRNNLYMIVINPSTYFEALQSETPVCEILVRSILPKPVEEVIPNIKLTNRFCLQNEKQISPSIFIKYDNDITNFEKKSNLLNNSKNNDVNLKNRKHKVSKMNKSQKHNKELSFYQENINDYYDSTDDDSNDDSNDYSYYYDEDDNDDNDDNYNNDHDYYCNDDNDYNYNNDNDYYFHYCFYEDENNYF
jgi:hypothetical protein